MQIVGILRLADVEAVVEASRTAAAHGLLALEVPFTVPGDARPVPAGQVPVISMNGTVWTADPQLGPGTLVGVMPKN